MERSRTLTSSFGIAGDKLFTMAPLFNNYSLATVAQAFPNFLTDVGLLKEHNLALEKRTIGGIVVPEKAGVERFYSSDFKRPQMNNCEHLKDRFVNHAYSTFVKKATGTYAGVAYNRDSLNPYDPGIGTYRTRFAEYVSASTRAWWAMQPRFEGEVSMLNFLFELKDFKNLAKLVFKPTETAIKIKSLVKRLRQIDSRLARSSAPISVVRNIADTGASSLKIAAQMRLLNQFALKPLINDVVLILKQAQETVESVQAEFEQKGLSEQVRHYSENTTYVDTLPSVSNPIIYWTIPYGLGTHHSSRFTATMEYKYSYAMRNAASAFRQYWGLEPSLEALWNAAPWSFLVDYFLKIGSVLHDVRLDPNVVLSASQYCESVLTSYSNGYCSTGHPDIRMVVDGKIATRGTIVVGRSGTFYERRVGFPIRNRLPLPKLKLPSGNQGINMAALAICFLK